LNRIVFTTGLLERDGAVLLVASQYPNQPVAIWNLPGGRQRPGELLPATLAREFREEVGLAIDVGGLRYVAESYDRSGDAHVVCAAFDVEGSGDPALDPSDPHVVAMAWVPRAELPARLAVRVIREPMLQNLADPSRRYFGFADAGITISFADSS